MGTFRNKIVLIGMALLMIATLGLAILASNVQQLMMTDEDKLALTYHQFDDEDKKVENCENVEFLAYFARDLNKDGIAEKIAGTSKELSQRDTLYMELNVLSDGYLEDGKITFSNGNNYKVGLSGLYKDEFYAENYINVSDAKEIKFNTVNAGTQRLILASIAQNTGKTVGNFTKSSTVTLTGTHVSSDGETRTPINKEIALTVDWYGIVNAYIDAPSKNYTRQIAQTAEDLQTEEFGVDRLPESAARSFTVQFSTGDRANQLPLVASTTTVKVPTLNGYLPEYVNPAYGIYDSQTRTITYTYAQNANVPDRKSYSFEIKYPLAAYKKCFKKNASSDWQEDARAEFYFEVNTSYTGENNPNYNNPYTSTAKKGFSIIINLDRGGTILEPIITKDISFHNDLYVESYNGKRYFDGNKLLAAYDNEDQEYFYYVVDYHVYNNKDEDSAITIYNVEQDKLGSRKLDLYETDCFIYMDESAHEYALGEEGTIDVYGVEYVNEPLGAIGHSLEYASYTHAGNLTYGKRVLGDTKRDSVFVKNYLDEYFGQSFTNDIINELRYSEWDFIVTGEDFGNIQNGDISPTWIKIETSPMKAHTSMKLSVVKRLNMDMVRQAFTREEIKTAGSMSTYMNEGIGTNVQLAFVKSDASINWNDGVDFRTQIANNPVINRTFTINTTHSNDLLYTKWKDGEFVVVFPEEFASVEVNSVIGNNVDIKGYSLNKTSANTYYLKIITENDTAVSNENITVDVNVIPDARSKSKTTNLGLYYYNPYYNEYYNTNTDYFDANNNGSKTDIVGYARASTSIVASETLITIQTVSDYDEEGNVTVAPNSAELSKETRSANINLSVVNNYLTKVSGTKILGRVPYEGNKYVLVDREIGSDFTAAMTGPIAVPDSIKTATTVYYSEEGTPTKDITNSANGWVTEENVTDWSKIKSYLIDFSSLELNPGYQYEFTYPVVIPEGLNYNDSSYATHSVEYDYHTATEGTIHLETEPTKVGLKIARLYNLTGAKFKEGKDLRVKGAIYELAETTSTGDVVKRTALISDSEGNFSAQGIYVNAIYEVREISAPQDYLLNNTVYKFQVKEQNDGTLTFEYKSDKHFRTETITKDAEDNDLAYIELEDEPKYQINVTYVDKNTERPLYGVVTTLDNTNFQYSDENGKISYTRLTPGTEYELEEIQVKGSEKENYTFKLDKIENGYEATLDEHMIFESIVNDNVNHLVQLNVRIEKETNPIYTLEVVKVEKDASKNNLSSMKKIPGAVFSLERVDDHEFENDLTTNENGVATAEGLYQYVEGKPITGKYILTEKTAPAGYIQNTEEISFVVTKENEELKVEIENRDSLTSIKDVLIEGNKVTFVIQDIAYFKLTKTDSETGDLLPNAKFVIYELDNNGNIVDCAKDINGNYVGEQDEGTEEDSPYYVYTNAAGEISVPLRDGKYKIEEVEAPAGYVGAVAQTFEIKNQTETSNEVAYELNETNVVDDYVEPTRTNTVEIKHIEDLLDMSKDMVENDNTYSDTIFVLKNDLDFNEESSYRTDLTVPTTYGDLNGDESIDDLKTELTTGNGFMAIGEYVDGTSLKVKPFSGTFDGQNHEIKNINSSYQYAGLFGYLRNAVVKNLKVSGNINGSYSGGISAIAIENVKIENCENKATIVGSSFAGGMIGWVNTYQLTSAETDAMDLSAKLRIINCSSSGEMSGSSSYKGGMIGYLTTDYYNVYDSIWFKGCSNSSTFAGGQYVGGMVGNYYVRQATILQVIDCTNSGSALSAMMGNMELGTDNIKVKFKNITNTGNCPYVLTKSMQLNSGAGTFEVINCINEAETGVFIDMINGSSSSKFNTKFYNCINKGHDVAMGNSNVGGFVGYFSSGADYIDIVNCANEGDILYSSSYAGGFIGSLSSGSRDKLRIYNSYNSGNITASYYIGGFIGELYSNDTEIEIKNSYNTGKITNTSSALAGGFIGRLNNYKSLNCVNSYNEGEVEGQGRVAGLIGGISNQGLLQIEDCYNKGYLHAPENSYARYIGGIIAEIDYYGVKEGSYIRNCYNEGNMKSSSSTSIGCIIAFGNAGTIDNCYNKGNIEIGSIDYGVGGISGYGISKIINCTNYGKIKLEKGKAGGIVGQYENGQTIENCFNYGNITLISNSDASSCLGGIGGYVSGTDVKNCFNKGNILATDANRVGGIIGDFGGSSKTLECCYNTGDVTVLGANNGYGCTGGLVGYPSSNTIKNSYNEGDIVGGIVGGIASNYMGADKIQNCYSTGNVRTTRMVVNNESDNKVGALFPNTYTDYVYNSETGTYDPVEYSVVKNCYYPNNIEISSSHICENDTAVDYDYMTTGEFLNKLNVDGVWYQRNNLPPTLMYKEPIYGEATELNVTNDKEDFIISTRVDGPAGGTISGSDVPIYETVASGEDNEKSIEIEPAEDYTITKLTVNNRQINFASKMVGNSVVLEEGYFNNMDENKLVAVTFAKNPVEIQKVDEDTNEPLTGAKFQVRDYDPDWAIDANANAFGEVTRGSGNYYFTQDSNGDWISNNSSGNTVANSYLPIDLTNYKGTYTLKVTGNITYKYNNYGFLTIKENTTSPSATDSNGRFFYSDSLSGTRSTTLQGGKLYYLHMGYSKKSYTTNPFRITKIELALEDTYNMNKEFTVDENGKLVLDLTADKIWVTETEAPEGYELDSTTHEYDLTALTEPIVITNTKAAEVAPVVNAHYYLLENGEPTTKKVAADETQTGTIGGRYRTNPKNLVGLELDEANFPDKAVGVFTAEPIDVNYYYDVKDIDLTIHQYREGTEEKLAEDQVVTTTPEIEVANDTYTLDVNQQYVLNTNADYLSLTAGVYNLVDVYSSVANNLTIDDTLNYNRNAELTYTYEDRIYDIATRVNEHIETRVDGLTGEEVQESVAGGTISGQNELIYEQVTPGQDATKDIVVTADTGYVINKVTITSTADDGTEITKVLYGEGAEECELTYEGDNKSLTLSKFTNLSANKVVTAEFIPQATRALVHYIIQGNTEDYRTETITGNVGDYYTTSAITIPGYELVSSTLNTTGYLTEDIINVYYYYAPVDCTINFRYEDKNSGTVLDTDSVIGKCGNSITIADYAKTIENYVLVESPTEETATYTIEPQTYVFKYAKNATVRAIYVAQGTIAPALADEVVINGYEGKAYTTSAKEIAKYELVGTPTNAEGTMAVTNASSETLVVYEYVKKNTKVVEKYVDINSNEVVSSIDHNGKVDDEYKITPSVPEGYMLITEDEEGNSLLPTNAEGTMTEEVIEVVFKVAKPATVRAIYVAQGTIAPALADEVVINGYEGKAYTTSAKEIAKYELVGTPTNAEGTMTVTNASSETLVVYEYVKKNTKVVEKYVDINSNEVVSSIDHNGKVDDPYEITPSAPQGYMIITEDAEGNSLLPTNAEGTMTEEVIEVVYKVAKPATVRAIYVAQGTIAPALADEVVINGYEGKAYTTSAKEIAKYELVGTPTNAEGTMTVTATSSETLVVYEYVKKSTKVVEKYVDINSNEVVSSIDHPGKIDDEYEITPSAPEGYVLLTEDAEGNSLLPTNAEGIMTEEVIEVIYKVAKAATVRAIYVEDGTDTKLATDVVINGYEGKAYETEAKTVTNYTLKETPANATGTMAVTDESSETLVKYEYIKNSANVVEKYVDINSNEVASTTNHPGHVGDEYEITPTTPEGYVLMTEDGEGNSLLPTNAEGTMTEETIEVIYKVAKAASVRAIYVKDGTDNKIAEDVVISGYEGKAYQTNAKTVDGYTLKATPLNANGTMAVTNETSETIVRYEYTRNEAEEAEDTKVVEKYVDINSNEVVSSTDHNGKVGDEYEITPTVPTGYVLITEDANGNSLLPTNAEGTMTEEVIEVIYKVAKEAKVTVKYVDTDTNANLANSVEIPGYEGKAYKAEEKEFEGYNLKEIEGTAEGAMTAGNQEVIYKYEKEEEPVRDAYVRVIYIDTETKEKISEDTIIEGYEGKPYQTTAKEIENYELLLVPTNAKGTMTITEDIDGNINNETLVKYIYKLNKATKVVEKYVDINTNKTVEQKEHPGKVGDSYKVTPEIPEGYVLIEKDKDGNSILPENTEGRMTEEVIEVVYYVAKDARVIVKYTVRYDNDNIGEDVIIPGYEGKEYKAEEKKIDGYELVGVEGEKEGAMKAGDNIVTFYYAKKATGIIPQTGINGINVLLYAMFAIVVIAGANGIVYVVYKRK